MEKILKKTKKETSQVNSIEKISKNYFVNSYIWKSGYTEQGVCCDTL